MQTLYGRFKGYLENKEPLAAVAYFCLTMLEKHLCKDRKGAANRYGIDVKVLRKVGNLTSTKGGPKTARKAAGVDISLTPQECRFLEEAVKTMIRRVAEVAHDPNLPRAKITLSDLPEISS